MKVARPKRNPKVKKVIVLCDCGAHIQVIVPYRGDVPIVKCPDCGSLMDFN